METRKKKKNNTYRRLNNVLTATTTTTAMITTTIMTITPVTTTKLQSETGYWGWRGARADSNSNSTRSHLNATMAAHRLRGWCDSVSRTGEQAGGHVLFFNAHSL